MSGSTLGTLFTVTTFGESHGPAIGCVIARYAGQPGAATVQVWPSGVSATATPMAASSARSRSAPSTDAPFRRTAYTVRSVCCTLDTPTLRNRRGSVPIVLHRYLRWRLPGYHPDQHLGGVLYLFLRGMCGPETPVVDGHVAGVFDWSPPAALVTELSDLLDGITA